MTQLILLNNISKIIKKIFFGRSEQYKKDEMFGKYEDLAKKVVGQFGLLAFDGFEREFSNIFCKIREDDLSSGDRTKKDFWCWSSAHGVRPYSSQLARSLEVWARSGPSGPARWTILLAEDGREISSDEIVDIIQTSLSGKRTYENNEWLLPEARECFKRCDAIALHIENRRYDEVCSEIKVLMLNDFYKLSARFKNRDVKNAIQKTHELFVKDAARYMDTDSKIKLLDMALFNLGCKANIIEDYAISAKDISKNGNPLLEALSLSGRYEEMLYLMQYGVSTKFMRSGKEIDLVDDFADTARNYPRNWNAELKSVLEKRDLMQMVHFGSIKNNTSKQAKAL